MVEEDSDGLVRTMIAKYSLIQHLTEAQRLEYKGVTVKYIRITVERVVLIVPVEEQDNFVPITEKEKTRAREAALSAKQLEQLKPNKIKVSNKNVNQMIVQMIQARAISRKVFAETCQDFELFGRSCNNYYTARCKV